MTRLTWDRGDYPIEKTLEQGVLYLPDAVVPWNGLVSLTENPGNMVETAYYHDGFRYLVSSVNAEPSYAMNAFMYPEEFKKHSLFNLSYRSEDSRLIHLLYNATAHQPTMDRTSLGDTADLDLFSWEVRTKPIRVPGGKPSDHFVIDISYFSESAISALEEILYGSESSNPYFPSVTELIDLFDSYAVMVVVNHEDGTWTVTGPDDIVQVNPDGSFVVQSPTVTYIDEDTYTTTSW